MWSNRHRTGTGVVEQRHFILFTDFVIISSGQLVLYKEAASMSGQVAQGHGCFAHLVSTNFIK